MSHKLQELFRELEIDADTDDLHIMRNLSSFVAVSEAEVVGITDPKMKYCPLADLLSDGIDEKVSIDELKNLIKNRVEEKISKFGHFTDKREILREDIAVPFGASEMILYAMRNGLIDAAVLVCDGAGSVVVDSPQVVQGVGSRMNGVFYTSRVEGIIQKLEEKGCHIVSSETADIDQVEAVKRAAELGYEDIVVTVNGYLGEDLQDLREVESDKDVTVYIIVVCTTDAEDERIEEFGEFADLVWSCASEGVREVIGKNSILQIATAIPVFVLTERGLRFVSVYSEDRETIANLDISKQYIISRRVNGQQVKLGDYDTYLKEWDLPMRVEKEPRPLL